MKTQHSHLKILYVLVIVSAAYFGGCSPEAITNLDSISPDWPYEIEIIERADGRLDYFWQIDSSIEHSGISRLPYHNAHRRYKFAVVDGRIGISGRRYPVIIDTGSSQPIVLSKSHVKENGLAELKMNTSRGKIGLCYLQELVLGDVKLKDWPCLSFKPRAWSNTFKIAAENNNFVIVGMPVLREFRYVRFDNISNYVEFSFEQRFDPEDANSWSNYPITVEEDWVGNTYLLVRIPVEGKEVELQLDTGSGRGLAVSQKLWDSITLKRQPAQLKKSSETYPYIGKFRCLRGKADSLEVGNRIVADAQISVFADDCPLVEDSGGLLGMQLFSDTALVIDFEKDMLWIKK